MDGPTLTALSTTDEPRTMESRTRTLTKAVTWQLSGLFTMTLLGYLYTGSVRSAGSLALVTAVTGAICYVLHERLWGRISWGTQASLKRPRRRSRSRIASMATPVTLRHPNPRESVRYYR